MERLAGVDELLDGPLHDLDELAGNLRDMRRANRLLGGVRLSRLALARLAEAGVADGQLALIDVGSGGADIPMALMADAARNGRTLTVTAVDARPEVLDAARRARPAVDRVAGLELIAADGRSLPYPDGAFDVAHSSMVVHHLDPAAAVALLREMSRVSRSGIVVNDLVRGRHAFAWAWLFSRVTTRNRLTRHDAPLSVRRAYSRAELRNVVGEAGLRIVGEVGGLFGHRVAIAAVRR
jgi:ubiquinone/menaquinone biosynthesis C-methylase UbiE